MEENSSNTHPLQPTSPLAGFSYLHLSSACVIRLCHARACWRQRRLASKRLLLVYLFMVILMAFLTGSVWLLMSSYSTKIVTMERNFSYVYTPNSLFVDKIIVTNRLENEGPIIYGFSTSPKLDKVINWTDMHDAVVQSQGHQEWGFWLNRGSQVELRYNISDPNLMLLLVVVKGEKGLRKWDRDQSPAHTALMVPVQGAGDFEYDVDTDDRYFFGFQNTQFDDVQVNVTLILHSRVYSNDSFKSKCHLTSSKCVVHLDFLGSTALLLTSPQELENGSTSLKVKSLQQDFFLWSVSVTFEQYWLVYLIFWGAMAIVMLILLILCRPTLCNMDSLQDATSAAQEATSLMDPEEDEENVSKAEQTKTSSIILSEDDLETLEGAEDFLCIICFDRQRNCFLDPCGHTATCYTCSKRIAKEKKGVCPLCRKPIQHVKKFFVS